MKWEKRKAELQKWDNGVGNRIEKKLKKELLYAESVIEVQLYSRLTGKYSVQLSSSRRLVVNLCRGECTCRWWQLQGFPCRHAMAVIQKEKKWVYDFVNECYKCGAQKMCYMNSVHPMETHDMAAVDETTGSVIGGEALDDEFNRRILPPTNPRKRGRPESNRRESQTQGVRVKRCSKCGEPGHYKNSCRNRRADFADDDEGYVVAFEELVGGQ